MKKISYERIEILNNGHGESKNLMEFLSIDPEILLKNTFHDFNYPKLDHKTGVVQKLHLIADEINNQFGFKKFQQFAKHQSDYIRSLACYLVDKQKIFFEDKLNLIKNLADDQNSGVREWAWLAIRNDFSQNLLINLQKLDSYISDNSPNIRRFASELSRPRGVWCKHIAELREKPWLGMNIIEPLKSDNSKYVQLSVGNWLNDASKDHANWVEDICLQWQKSSNSKNTENICKRALRTIRKKV